MLSDPKKGTNNTIDRNHAHANCERNRFAKQLKY